VRKKTDEQNSVHYALIFVQNNRKIEPLVLLLVACGFGMFGGDDAEKTDSGNDAATVE